MEDSDLQGMCLSRAVNSPLSVMSTRDGASSLRLLGYGASRPTPRLLPSRFPCRDASSICAPFRSSALIRVGLFRGGASIRARLFVAHVDLCSFWQRIDSHSPFHSGASSLRQPFSGSTSPSHSSSRTGVSSIALLCSGVFSPVPCLTICSGLQRLGFCSSDFLSPASDLDATSTLGQGRYNACRQWCPFSFARVNTRGFGFLRIGSRDCMWYPEGGATRLKKTLLELCVDKYIAVNEGAAGG